MVEGDGGRDVLAREPRHEDMKLAGVRLAQQPFRHSDAPQVLQVLVPVLQPFDPSVGNQDGNVVERHAHRPSGDIEGVSPGGELGLHSSIASVSPHGVAVNTTAEL